MVNPIKDANVKVKHALENAGIYVKGIDFVDEHNYLDKCRQILEIVGNLRLVGETGTGKTTLIHKLAEMLEVPLFEIVLTRDVTKWDLLACDTLDKGSTTTREGIIIQWLNSEKGLLYIDGFNYAEPSIISLLESLADFRGCAEEHSLVMTVKGLKQIRTVKEGDMVLTHDKNGTRFIKVQHVFKFPNVKEEFIRLTTENGRQLIVSKDHKIILNNFCEVQAKDLNIGNSVYCMDSYDKTEDKRCIQTENVESTTNGIEIGLLSRLNRWGRNNNYNVKAQNQEEGRVSTIGNFNNSQHIGKLSDLVTNFRVQKAKTQAVRTIQGLLSTLLRGIWNIAITETNRALLNGQTKTMPISDSIHRKTIRNGNELTLRQTGCGNNDTSKNVEYEGQAFSYKTTLSKIVKIEKFYETLNYVDLTTENHKYFANGILIHNSVWIPEYQKEFIRTAKHYLAISYNPSEKSGYSGTFLENIATIRRFEGLIIDYLSPQKERQLISKFAGNYNFSAKFVEIAKKTRTEYENGKLRTPLTTGNLINYGKLYKNGMTEEDIIEIASSLFTAREERNLFLSFFENSDDIDIEALKKQDTN